MRHSSSQERNLPNKSGVLLASTQVMTTTRVKYDLQQQPETGDQVCLGFKNLLKIFFNNS